MQAELINEHFVVFVVATTGSGREPRAMTPLWQMLLRADLPEDLFEELHFAVFGLGDTAYEKFCWPAKLLSRRLQALGALELCARGEGDEQQERGYALYCVLQHSTVMYVQYSAVQSSIVYWFNSNCFNRVRRRYNIVVLWPQEDTIYQTL